MRRISCLLLFLLLLAGCGGAEEASTDSAADGGREPAPDTSAAATAGVRDEALRYFAGRWLATAEDPTTGRSFTLHYDVEPVLGGAWLSGAGESPELGIRVRDMWGRDPASGEIVRVIFQGDGTHGTIRSPGWSGDTLRFVGGVEAAGGTQRLRETIVRLGPDEFDAVWEAHVDGSWTVYSDEHLVRQPER